MKVCKFSSIQICNDATRYAIIRAYKYVLTWLDLSWLDVMFLNYPALIEPVPTWHVFTWPDHFRLYLSDFTWPDLICPDLTWPQVEIGSWLSNHSNTLYLPSRNQLFIVQTPSVYPAYTLQTPSRHPQDAHQTPFTCPWGLLIP